MYSFVFKTMDKRLARIERGYQRFLNTLHSRRINSHYDISHEFDITVTKTSDETFMVYINYENNPPLIAQLQLPTDINTHIKSFLHAKKHMYASIGYPSDYPFRPPKWAIVDSTINLKNELIIFNKSLDASWLPCMDFDNELLCYLVWAIQLF